MVWSFRLPRVVDAAPVSTVEAAADIPSGEQRVAFVAHWSPGTRQPRSTTRLISELQRLGYRTIVCSTSPAEGPLAFSADPDVRCDELTVLRRPNLGYDFGSWAVAMERYEHLLDRENVLLVNDSLVGPFGPLDDIISDFEHTTSDIWGMVESSQFTSHLQSYFRGFRYGVLAEPAMRRYWRDIRVVGDKDLLIERYEYGFTTFAVRYGYSTAAFVDHRQAVGRGLNPTIQGWRALLDAGVPFVKRELVRRPDLASDGYRLPQVVAERFGTDVMEWL